MGSHGQIIFVVVIVLAIFVVVSYVFNPDQVSVSDEPISTSSPAGEPEVALLAEPESEEPPEEEDLQVEPSDEPEVSVIPPEERAGSVYISSIRRSYRTTPGYLRLRTKLNEGESVNITDWRIESNRSEFTIPQAVNRYSIFSPNIESDVVLERSNYIYLYFSKSPISKNFRLNKCTGYLNDTAEFSPSLPKKCPVLPRDSYQYLSGDCQDYIRRLGRCELPDPNVTNAFMGEAGNDCRAFINENINIGSCYRTYGNEPDFLSSEWRAWINRDIFDSDHDWVRLYNTTGMLISEYVY